MSSAAPEVREIRDGEQETTRAVVLDAYGALPGAAMGPTYARLLGDVEDRAARAVVLVAVDDGDVCGCVTYVPGPGPYAEFEDTDAAGIRMLAVASSAQGRGIGELLVRACIERAGAEGRRRIVLHSTASMATAQRLYVRAGFRRSPERDWQVEDGPYLLGYERDIAR